VAVTFKDDETAKEVMAAKRPVHQKKLGRQVKNYDEHEDEWEARCKSIVKKANLAKVCATSYVNCCSSDC